MTKGKILFKGTEKDDELIKKISYSSEHNKKRKEIGSFYTPHDLANYIVANSFIHNYYPNLHDMYSFENCVTYFSENRKYSKELLYKCLVFDPTCGAGDLLLSVLEFKFSLAYYLGEKLSEKNVLRIISTIYGNDYSKSAINSFIKRVIIYKKRINDNISDKLIVGVLKKNITLKDYIKYNYPKNRKYDIIVGNPPYVEENEYCGKINNKYGNVYCNVLSNCFQNVKNIISLIVPISYVSTPRMNKIREEVTSHKCEQIISSYADRPDCLFNSVHQKLNVLVIKLNSKPNIYTTQYKYWFKDERSSLFDKCRTYQNRYATNLYIPKLGNHYDESIFRKVKNGNNSFYNLQNTENYDYPIYLNMRAAFWVKCFTSSSKSNEYNAYYYDKNIRNFIFCVLNSSLFFWYWITISDCWHITNKELSSFNFDMPNFNPAVFNSLSKKLETSLDKTKKYIGSKQAKYAYKHKYCKNIIDQIDFELARLYDLTPNEYMYIIGFAARYRGVVNEGD